jgi:hypothetical protein
VSISLHCAIAFEERGVEFVNGDLDDFGHDRNYWRIAIQDLSKRVFKSAN